MDTNQSHRGKNPKGAKRLTDDLAAINSDTSFMSMEENEMLSLMVDETLKGVDITIRYPAFYQKLLGNAELRRAFLDTLESVESEKIGEVVPFPEVAKSNLAFLTKQLVQPGIEKLDENHWTIKWQKKVEQLQAIFFPAKLAYRSDPSSFDDFWFTLLRGDVTLGGSVYSVLLECGISEEMEDALSPSLNLAITFEPLALSAQPVIYVTLHWGSYTERLKMTGEGRVNFPDVPFAMTFDKQDQSIESDLDLILEIGP